MDAIISRSRPTAAKVFHWAGCIAGTGLVLLFAGFIVGEGPPPLNVGWIALSIMLVGFLLGWWNDLAGGLVSLLGISTFYLWNFAQAGGFPGGPVFPLCFIPGVLYLVSWLKRCRPRL